MARSNEDSKLALGIDIGMTQITATYYKNDTFTHKSIKPKASNRKYEKIKAFIGRRFDDPKLDDLPLNYPFNYIRWDPKHDKRLVEPENLEACDNLKIISDDEILDPVEPMIDLISELKERIEEKLRTRLDNVTISIPVRFDNNQKNKMILACKLSGFEYIRVLTEPSAVAMAYVFDKKKTGKFKNECFFVVDIGSYFLDVGIFETSKIEKKDYLGVLALDGECIGACKFDEVLVSHCIKNLKKMGFDERVDENETLLLYKACEKARKQLNKTNLTEIKVGMFKEDKDFNLKITNDEFNEMCKDLFKKIMDRIKGTLILMRRMKPYYNEEGFYKTNSLDEAYMDTQKEEINQVILSGKFSKTFKIQEMIREYFGSEKVNTDFIGKKVVSIGSSYHAFINENKNRKDDKYSLIFEDVIPYPFNMVSDTGTRTEIFRKNEFYPTSRTIAIETETAYQTEMNFKIVEGDDINSFSNLILKKCIFKGIPPAPRATYRVPFNFILDFNGLLNIFIINHETGENDIFYVNTPAGKISEKEFGRIKEEIVFRREKRKKNLLRIKIEERIYKLTESITESTKETEKRKEDLENLDEIQEFLDSSEIITLTDYKSYKKRLKTIKNKYRNEESETSEDTSGESNEEKIEVAEVSSSEKSTVENLEVMESEYEENEVTRGSDGKKGDQGDKIKVKKSKKIKESKKDRVFNQGKDDEVTVKEVKSTIEKSSVEKSKEVIVEKEESKDIKIKEKEKLKEENNKEKENDKEKEKDKDEEEEKEEKEEKEKDKDEENDKEVLKDNEIKMTESEIENEKKAKAYIEKKDQNKKCY